ncbi:hypothetical protein GCM10010361_54910 [Streptomyces olivaceiscleroticus]|uniref:Uncharacterized protein n=1 Tax=Streptomyces olivaceiscleroticus TaxID=68245 RepID=A0ABN1ASQ5_9ACTN
MDARTDPVGGIRTGKGKRPPLRTRGGIWSEGRFPLLRRGAFTVTRPFIAARIP